jgi:hypothetical protein
MFKPNTECRVLDLRQSLESSSSEVAISRLIRCKFASRRIYLDFSRQPLPLRINTRTCGKITLVPQIPEANLSLNIRELPRCACAASPRGRAQAVVRPHSEAPFKGCGQGRWLREVAGGIVYGEGPELIGCV